MEDIIFKRRSIRLFKNRRYPKKYSGRFSLPACGHRLRKPAALEDDRCSGKIKGNNALAHERGD